MDFLKTLLAYMALLTTLGVQEGPAQDTIPTPTPLPAHVTATPVPNQTAAPTATPSPTARNPMLPPFPQVCLRPFGSWTNPVLDGSTLGAPKAAAWLMPCRIG